MASVALFSACVRSMTGGLPGLERLGQDGQVSLVLLSKV